MIGRLGENLGLHVDSPPQAAVALERDGYALLPAGCSPTAGASAMARAPGRASSGRR